MAWKEVAADVFVQRYEPFEVNIVVIAGPSGATVVDTRNSPAEAQEIVADVAAQFGVPIIAAINTHAHYDHSFGNSVFAELGIPIYGHHLIPAHYDAFEGPRLAAWQEDPAREADKNWQGVVLTPPTVLLRQAATLTASGRDIHCLPLAPGHTDTDLAVWVPDARVWILGDVIEESAPPMFGSGSWPLDWPAALDELLPRILPGDVVVPGHGKAVDRAFVARQSADLGAVADAVRSAWAAGKSVNDAVADADVPWPKHMLHSAFEQGYAQLAQRPNPEQ